MSRTLIDAERTERESINRICNHRLLIESKEANIFGIWSMINVLNSGDNHLSKQFDIICRLLMRHTRMMNKRWYPIMRQNFATLIDLHRTVSDLRKETINLCHVDRLMMRLSSDSFVIIDVCCSSPNTPPPLSWRKLDSRLERFIGKSIHSLRRITKR